MTNSKQYCEHCNERWNYSHLDCIMKKTKYTIIQMRLNGKSISWGYLDKDGSVMVVFPEFYIKYFTVEDWKKEYMVDGSETISIRNVS